MNRATPTDIRKGLEMAKTLAEAGMRFIPMPVFDDDDQEKLVLHMQNRIEKVLQDCQDAEGRQ